MLIISSLLCDFKAQLWHITISCALNAPHSMVPTPSPTPISLQKQHAPLCF